MRLTRKQNNNNYTFGFGITQNQRLLNNKLGQLEDIEDELGISLITLFKAFKNGCYGIQNGKVYKMNIVRLDNQDKENIILFRNKTYGGECYLLKDYGKTWALTKEELQEKFDLLKEVLKHE